MSTNDENKNNLPEWQKISGLTPEREKNMSDNERDAAVRVLLKEVERIARDEFARGEDAPAGERTVFWSPLEKICRKLEISRVKLSSFSRELTGMRAHEITDRIQAEKFLKKAMFLRVEKWLKPELEKMRGTPRLARMKDAHHRNNMCKSFCKWVKSMRSDVLRARWAAALGFANASRLARACLLAFGISIDELEGSMVYRLVQKFLDEAAGDLPQRAQRAQRNGEEEKNLVTAEAATDSRDDGKAAAIIKEAVEAVMREKVAVA